MVHHKNPYTTRIPQSQAYMERAAMLPMLRQGIRLGRQKRYKPTKPPRIVRGVPFTGRGFAYGNSYLSAALLVGE